MITYENECCGPCPMGCIGNACSNRNVPHYFCDECGAEVSELYDGMCYDCKNEELDEEWQSLTISEKELALERT